LIKFTEHKPNVGSVRPKSSLSRKLTL